jgi:hypothetical protein
LKTEAKFREEKSKEECTFKPQINHKSTKIAKRLFAKSPHPTSGTNISGRGEVEGTPKPNKEAPKMT